MTGLADRARDPIANLSGGMRRRLDLARALLHRPELVLLDEPTTGIDPGERRALWDALRQSRDAGVTVVLATNDLAEADAVCDAVAFAREGRVLATGNPTELKRGLAAESLHLTWASPAESQLAAVANLPGVSTVTADRDTVRVTARDASALIPALFATAPGQVRAVSLQPTSLEDAYFRIVGQRSREGGAP
jgi:ABC-2 type transport system ATP-binding protein